jgi:hypothetical protein
MPGMDKIDFRTERKDLYAPTTEFDVVEVPRFEFFAVSGRGDPNTSEEYADAVAALYAVSYAAKFASKRVFDRDYVVAPLEGLWPMEARSSPKSEWSWTMLLRQPDWLTAEVREHALEAARTKQLAAADRVRFEVITEGLSVQILHVGAYDDEAPTIARLHDEFLPQRGLVENGDHHEIYLSDPRRVEPAKLRTVLRQPVLEKTVLLPSAVDA